MMYMPIRMCRDAVWRTSREQARGFTRHHNHWHGFQHILCINRRSMRFNIDLFSHQFSMASATSISRQS
jgi:hypothetical protein